MAAHPAARLPAEQRARRRPQIRRRLVVVLRPDRGLSVLVLDLRRFDDTQIFVVDQIGTHLFGTPACRGPEAPRVGRVLGATRRGREEVHRVSVDVTLLKVGRVFGYRVRVIVIDVDVVVVLGFGFNFGFDFVVLDDTVGRRRDWLVGDHRKGSGGFGFLDVVTSNDRDLAGQLRDRD